MMSVTTSETVGLAICSAVAALVLAKAWRLYDFFFCPPKQPLHRYKILGALPTEESTDPSTEYNAWALITGSSAGIGFGYAHYLLSCGFGVVILAHENIPAALEQLRTLHPDMAKKDRIKGFTMDCTTASPTDIKNLISQVSHLPITILINNVGSIPISYPHMRPFWDYDAEGIDACINLNARFMTHMTCLMIPVLRRNVEPSGGRALILNVSSQAHLGMPLLSMYSASKGHVTALSATLAREFRVFGEPIDCLCIVPNEVLSQGNSVAPPGSVVDVDYARMCLERVENAVDSGMTAVMPYWKHYLQAVAAGLIGEARFTTEVMKAMEAKRDALAKVWGSGGPKGNTTNVHCLIEKPGKKGGLHGAPRVLVSRNQIYLDFRMRSPGKISLPANLLVSLDSATFFMLGSGYNNPMDAVGIRNVISLAKLLGSGPTYPLVGGSGRIRISVS
ncbi:hypothetical protein PoMZ_10903 [Pyricularia oryzae]|uniref:Estradiol 17-beta-dehydrogenase 12 n=1 Tax=Pyricularia oryzae TaxID=318829 RepID=A0A4P7NJ29_PYROR|nr:hypothetical protein PoMZ_10903 [Pyricularia oryzae]